MHRSERALEVVAIPTAMATLAIPLVLAVGLDRTAIEIEIQTETKTEALYAELVAAAAEAAGGPAAVATAVATTTAVSPTVLVPEATDR